MVIFASRPVGGYLEMSRVLKKWVPGNVKSFKKWVPGNVKNFKKKWENVKRSDFLPHFINS